jgi:hypothetical protein
VTVDPKRIIAAVAEYHGVLLDRDDPLLMTSTVLGLHAQDHRDREDRLAERDRQLLAGMQAVLAQVRAEAARSPITEDQIDEIGKRVVWKCHAWANTTLERAHALTLMWIGICFLVFGAACGGAGWYLASRPLSITVDHLQCENVPGGLFCGYFAAMGKQ